MKLLSDMEQITSRDLIRKAEEAGLLDSNVTTNCFHCKAIFPKEYVSCPQCNTEQLDLRKKI